MSANLRLLRMALRAAAVLHSIAPMKSEVFGSSEFRRSLQNLYRLGLPDVVRELFIEATLSGMARSRTSVGMGPYRTYPFRKKLFRKLRFS
jgi:hypothetical protein